jgi:predicted RNase H-like HicB family nuclease
MKHNIQAYIYKGEEYYVAECIEISVVTQGKTLDETIANLQEAVSLHLEGEDPAEFGLVENPTILVIMELETIANVA